MTKLSREQRRLQLLAMAEEIVRDEGTNALTLVRLAERAEVSRPIAYDHFKTREGLLMALYQRYDEMIGQNIRDALPGDSASLDEVVSVICTAYIDGVLAAGPQCDAVYAALAGHPETRAFLRSSRQFYVSQMQAALARFADLSGRKDRAVLVGFLGVIEAVARDAADRRLSRAAAIDGATAVIVGGLRNRVAVKSGRG
ncbi:TetR/AcrR family transcriptional regulator [Allorhizocola rhizosphaerae]|uniref:TetR/AcrR family transcriptional regulator n=1 Tax=Allorhizocola rhizosphaerae TaxID=1872709 RepID=UPI001B8BFAD1|nr:TetR/AcrR family transcriptional regulator [Allorhizocola rhizosphaerae]